MKTRKTIKLKSGASELYEYKMEALPCNSKYLPPRNYLKTKEWKILLKSREEQIKGLYCENCGTSNKVLHLHESFDINKNIYKVTGVYYLCSECHQRVHSCLYGLVSFDNDSDDYKRCISAIMFGFEKDIIVDYSFLNEYGINHKDVENDFYLLKKHNQKETFVETIWRHLISDVKTNKYIASALLNGHHDNKYINQALLSIKSDKDIHEFFLNNYCVDLKKGYLGTTKIEDDFGYSKYLNSERNKFYLNLPIETEAKLKHLKFINTESKGRSDLESAIYNETFKAKRELSDLMEKHFNKKRKDVRVKMAHASRKAMLRFNKNKDKDECFSFFIELCNEIENNSKKEKIGNAKK